MDKIDEILTRGVENIIPGKEPLEKLLRSGKKLNVYNGIDPTAVHVHIGNAVPLRKLQAFVELGHNVTFLIGDFTALVGDASDKESERPILSAEQIAENFKTYKSQAEKVLDFSKIKIAHNSDWLGKLTFKEIISLFQKFSLNDFISRELIKKRLVSGGHIRLDEVVYPVMQGFDSYHLDTDIQIGGTDQIFNMQAGRTLIKALHNKESFVISNGFLEGTDGRKMSKSWGNAIWLDDSPEEIFGKVMSVKDDLILQYFTLGTNLPLEDIDEIKKQLDAGKNPMEFKKQLGAQIVSELHSKSESQKALEHFEKTFQKGEVSSTDIPTIKISDLSKNPIDIEDLLTETKLAGTKSDAKRLADQGAVEINEKVQKSREEVQISSGDIIKVGKKKFLKFT